MNYSFSWNGLMFTFTWHRHLCKIFKTDLPANPDMKFPPAECREMATFFFCINHLKLCIFATFLRENQNVFRMSKKKIQSLWWRALKFATGRIRSLQVYNIGLELTLAKFWKTISSWIEYVWLSKHFFAIWIWQTIKEEVFRWSKLAKGENPLPFGFPIIEWYHQSSFPDISVSSFGGKNNIIIGRFSIWSQIQKQLKETETTRSDTTLICSTTRSQIEKHKYTNGRMWIFHHNFV